MYPVKIFKNNKWETIQTEQNEACGDCGRWVSTYHDCPEWNESMTMTHEEVEKFDKDVQDYWLKIGLITKPI